MLVVLLEVALKTILELSKTISMSSVGRKCQVHMILQLMIIIDHYIAEKASAMQIAT